MRGKAWGTYVIPDEIFKNEDTRSKMAVKLRDIFSQFLRNGKVPDYLMMAKLILISKDDTNTSTIDKVRSIGVLPVITKLFELSIINKLKKVFISPEFNNQQRGFMEGNQQEII